MSAVLVVEDEPAIAELIAHEPAPLGLRSADGRNRDEAIAEVDRRLPDLILLDWMLPGRAASSLARRWRSQPRTRDLPLIMLTARARKATRWLASTPAPTTT